MVKTGSGSIDLTNVPTWDEARNMVTASKSFLKKEYWVYLSLLAYTGARRNEIWNAKYMDLIWENGEVAGIEIYQEKKNDGKHNIDRRVTVSSDFIRQVPISQINKSLENYAEGEDPNEFMFSFSQRTCNNIVERASTEVLGYKISPHDLRKAMTLRMLRVTNGDLEKCKRILGHSNYDTLRIYLGHSQMDLTDEMKLAVGGEIEK